MFFVFRGQKAHDQARMMHNETKMSFVHTTNNKGLNIYQKSHDHACMLAVVFYTYHEREKDLNVSKQDFSTMLLTQSVCVTVSYSFRHVE